MLATVAPATWAANVSLAGVARATPASKRFARPVAPATRPANASLAYVARATQASKRDAAERVRAS
jgi:hypothetical protein